MAASSKKKILLWTLLLAAVVLAVGVVSLLTVPAPLERWLQGRMLAALQEHYQTEMRGTPL